MPEIDEADIYKTYVWFAAPDELPSIDDVPDYPGLLTVTEPRTVSVDSTAPQIHAETLCHTDRRYIERGLTVPGWQQRLG